MAYEAHKPKPGTSGTYQSSIPGKGAIFFEIVRVEGNLCYALYEGDTKPHPFIWRFHVGLNTRHDWPGKDAGS